MASRTYWLGRARISPPSTCPRCPTVCHCRSGHDNSSVFICSVSRCFGLQTSGIIEAPPRLLSKRILNSTRQLLVNRRPGQMCRAELGHAEYFPQKRELEMKLKLSAGRKHAPQKSSLVRRCVCIPLRLTALICSVQRVRKSAARSLASDNHPMSMRSCTESIVRIHKMLLVLFNCLHPPTVHPRSQKTKTISDSDEE